MLLWAGIYIYLQSQYEVSTSSDGVTISVPSHYARRMYDFTVVTIAFLFAFSLAIVNSALWATLKIINR